MKKMLVLFSICVMLFASCAFARTAKDGFKPEDCEEFETETIAFLIPKYFSNHESDESSTLYTTAKNDALLRFYSSSVSRQYDTVEEFNSFVQSNNKDVTDLTTVKVEIGGLPGFISIFKCTLNNTALEVVQAILYDTEKSGCLITGAQSPSGSTDYAMDFYKIIATAQPAGAQAKTSSDDEKPTEKSADASSSDFRKSMDDYKAFFEEYCEFMKKYMKADATDMASMLTDYTEFLTKYQTAMDALDNVDTSKLSTEDQKYYFDTMAEIQKMLLEVSQ